jgi:hypothetical protein
MGRATDPVAALRLGYGIGDDLRARPVLRRMGGQGSQYRR